MEIRLNSAQLELDFGNTFLIQLLEVVLTEYFYKIIFYKYIGMFVNEEVISYPYEKNLQFRLIGVYIDIRFGF